MKGKLGLIVVQINEDQANENSKGYSELVTARESATVTCVWQRFKGSQGSRRASQKRKGKAPGAP